MLKTVYILIASTSAFLQSNLFCLADLSLVVIDLKYNYEQGVKICEMQPGSFSRFGRDESSECLKSVPDLYCEILEQYNTPCYFTHPLYQKMKESFVQYGWSSAHSITSLLSKISQKPPTNPESLFDYQCFLFSLQIEPIIENYPMIFPHILFLDRAILPYAKNKLSMNYLFDSIEETKKLRPTWGVFPKETSINLVHRITETIPGDIIVIKPLESTMGRGVIILKKEDLQQTLNYIFLSDKTVLLNDLERSYSHYAVDKSDYFIVEEFIQSDPLTLEDSNLPYDCTARIVALLSYHNQIPDIRYLKEYWYSPSKPIHHSYSLIQSHKAKGTFFSTVDPIVLQEIKKQLSPALLKAYEKMVTQTCQKLDL